MKRMDYLKLSIQWKCYRRIDWFTTAFAVFREAEDAWEKDKFPGRIVSKPWGYSFVNQELELERIDDAKPGEPLFAMLEELTVDPTWLPNIKAPTLTLVGSLMANAILLVESFGSKIPYMAENISITEIEMFIIQNRGTEKEPEKIQIQEYQKMGQGVELMKMLHSFSVYSLTRKNTTKPTGLDEYKAKLIAEYGDKLKDPVYLAEFEDKLKAFDTEYLKGDPTLGKLVSGKIKNNGRRKLFLSSGAEGGLGREMVPITESLIEGVPLNPKNFAATVNGSRSGSYFRGVDTVKGGVSFKILIRVLSSFKVVPGDCGSLYGLETYFTKKNIETLVGRRLLDGKGTVIENITDAQNYLGKKLKLRSVIRCKSAGQTFCEVCAGPRLSMFKEGLAIPATDVTSTVLAASMAAMHKNTTTTTKLRYKQSLT